MPGMDGYEVCNRLKDDETTKHIPVIMISAIKTESDDLVKGFEIGADAYLAKPIDEYVLIAQVKTALRIKKAEDHLRGQKDLLEEMVQDKTFELSKLNERLKQEIEEQKRTEEALKESELRYRSLTNDVLDTSSVGIFILDSDFHVVWVNQALERYFGLRREEIIGKDKRQLIRERIKDIFEDPVSFAEKVFATYDDNTYIEHFECHIVPGSEREERWLEHWSQPILSGLYAGGRVEHYSDITERRSVEEQLRQSQKMEAIGKLAGGVAHDFNNLLTVIIGNAQLALMDVIKVDTLWQIRKAGERAASLTRQLLAFSRKQIVQPKILDINELLTDIEKILGRLIGEDVELLTIPEPELWQVEIDPGQMEQVIMNLAVNARDAMIEGGKLTIETANADLDKNYFHEHGIKGERPSHYVMLAIIDTGSGMDKETREHIFEPFFTTKEVGKGTGLGLSTVYGIVKQNDGFVWVYSEPGKGTTFKVYLPKVKGNAEPEEKEQTPVDDLSGFETVLIVEDDDSLRNFAQKILHIYGYRTLNAENGEDALRVCKEHDGQIDLMITDVVMPKMGGKELAERLRPLYPQMKVIYMSGYTDNAIVHHGVLEPGLNFLEKPFTLESLARKVRKALRSEKCKMNSGK
ncbi:MAG: response regulator [Deltaproteobacteria bacterium]|nr:response regulator [Deltaproteobacteria bacterium]